MSFSARAAILSLAVLLPLASTAQSADPVPDTPNEVCGPDVQSYSFSLADIAPQITGTWKAQAPGIGMTQGVQTFTVNISYENGRLYLSGNGAKTRLEPVRGTRKQLRYDFIRQRPLPEEAHAVKVSLEDFGLVFNCDLSVAPQFTWAMGSGERRSSGIYSFVSPKAAIGTMSNSAMGAREVYLSR